jgi:hypothetical protein
MNRTDSVRAALRSVHASCGIWSRPRLQFDRIRGRGQGSHEVRRDTALPACNAGTGSPEAIWAIRTARRTSARRRGTFDAAPYTRMQAGDTPNTREYGGKNAVPSRRVVRPAGPGVVRGSGTGLTPAGTCRRALSAGAAGTRRASVPPGCPAVDRQPGGAGRERHTGRGHRGHRATRVGRIVP